MDLIVICVSGLFGRLRGTFFLLFCSLPAPFLGEGRNWSRVVSFFFSFFLCACDS